MDSPCGPKSSLSKFTVEPAHPTVKGYEETIQPLKPTVLAPKFLYPLLPEIRASGNTTSVTKFMTPSYHC
jgi:hypothetical protein